MRFGVTGLLLLGAMPIGAAAQTAATPPPITRTVVAVSKLPGVTDAPLHFKSMRIVLPAGAASAVATAICILYQVSGTTEVVVGSDTRILNPGDGLFIAGGKPAMLKAGGAEPSTLLNFLLLPATELDRSAAAAPAAVTELYRTAAPIPDLKPGAYDINLTRVTFPPQMASNPPHHRSGAALYYIISGTGANTIDGNTIARQPGTLVYEPYDLVHQWGNPGTEPLTFLAFNINPEGVAAVLPGAPAKTP